MMRLTKESARYCILLILLLTTGAVAVGVTINFMEGAVPDYTNRIILTVAIWTMTMGFMLIAGAFGLWAVHFSAEAESLRKISLLVDRMNDIRDGILAIDRQGKIIGMNAAAEILFGAAREKSMQTVCTAISDAELDLILHADNMLEREYSQTRENATPATLRFRIQPALAGVSVLLVSDITTVAAARARQRRAASLQLAGHLAQGIANDFNDLLCGISGHVTLLAKPQTSTNAHLASTTAIQHCADRGIRLARQLIQLSHEKAQDTSNITTQIARHVSNGADLLASSLDRGWTISCKIEATPPPINIPPSQIEHIIHSLGLIVTETHVGTPTGLSITLRLPADKEPVSQQSRIAAILEISLMPPPDATTTVSNPDPQNHENGVISSLIQTLLEQAGGRCIAVPDGRKAHAFRIELPEVDPLTLTAGLNTEETLATGLEAYTAGWHVLLCMLPERNRHIALYLKEKDVSVDLAPDENALLQKLVAPTALDIIFIQPEILGQNLETIISVAYRISPAAAVILLTDERPANMPNHIVTIPPASSPATWIHAMIDARSRRTISYPTAPPANLEQA